MEIKLKKKSWKEISIKDYKKIVDISKRELDTDLEKDIAVLSILCGVDEDDIYNCNINVLKSLLDEMNWIKEPYNFNHKFKLTKLKIDDVEYEVQPDINKFTVAQYLDFTNFWDKRNERMGNLLAVFIIPKGHKYNEGYDVIELADRLEEVLSIDDWNSVCFFFMMNWINSTKASLLYSVYQMMMMIIKERNPQRKKMLKKELKKLVNQVKPMV